MMCISTFTRRLGSAQPPLQYSTPIHYCRITSPASTTPIMRQLGTRQLNNSYNQPGLYRNTSNLYRTNINSNPYGDNFGISKDYSDRPVRDQTDWNFSVTPEKDIPPVEVLNVYKEHPAVAGMTNNEAKRWREATEVTVLGDQTPNPILKFEHAPFHPMTVKKLKENYPAPSVIQSLAWPVALSGRDMVGCAATGSGKTLAFLLPAFEQIQAQMERNPLILPNQHNTPIVLVVAPTRELAQQIHIEATKFAAPYKIRTACLFGGQGNRSLQISQLRHRPHVLIATPGRLLDLHREGLFNLNGISYLVLDEADRMLEMGFEEQIRAIVNATSNTRQTLMWSATWPKAVEGLAKDYFKNYLKINIGSLDLQANPNIEQQFIFCEPYQKMQHLHNYFSTSNKIPKTLIFCSTKRRTEEVGFEISRKFGGKISLAALHGDKTQIQRNAVLNDFRSDILQVVISTDVASRGLDVNDVQTVFNYDFPVVIESYIHRIGRTARAGKKGVAISIFTPEDFAVAKDLIGVLRKSNQPIPHELEDIAANVKNLKASAQQSNNHFQIKKQHNFNHFFPPSRMQQETNRNTSSNKRMNQQRSNPVSFLFDEDEFA